MRRLDPEQVQQVQRALIRWYRRHGRDLPWRRTRDPYSILVSEVMLQQTQVKRVLDYYEPFLRRYPTIDALAESSELEVREAWAGLGYYARARNLHRAAQRVAVDHGGRVPADGALIRRLPGVGRYTAGAVLSLAYGQDAAILDTNAARVLARVFGARRRGSKSRWQTALWEIAEAVTPRGRADRFNQAIMDVGATICQARRPRCHACPLRAHCHTAARIISAAQRQPRGSDNVRGRRRVGRPSVETTSAVATRGAGANTRSGPPGARGRRARRK